MNNINWSAEAKKQNVYHAKYIRPFDRPELIHVRKLKVNNIIAINDGYGCPDDTYSNIFFKEGKFAPGFSERTYIYKIPCESHREASKIVTTIHSLDFFFINRYSRHDTGNSVVLDISVLKCLNYAKPKILRGVLTTEVIDIKAVRKSYKDLVQRLYTLQKVYKNACLTWKSR